MRSEHMFISSANNEYFVHFDLIFACYRISNLLAILDLLFGKYLPTEAEI